MKRHVKASSGEPTPQRANGRRGIFISAVVLVLLAFASAAHAKVVVTGFGAQGELGGQISPGAGIDINQTGNGAPAGTIYVADVNRIQRFSPSGSFERIWGADVVQTGGAGDGGGVSTIFEICVVASDCKVGLGAGAGGSQGVGFNGTANGIAINQSTGNVYASSDNARVFEFDPEGHFLRVWGWNVVRAGQPNDTGGGFEICDATAGNAANGSDCQTGESGSSGGQLSGGSSNLLIDSSGNVWVADRGNRRVQEFGADGHFIAAYGYDVDALGGSGGLEKCTSTVAGGCQAGTAGSLSGQFADGIGDIAFDSSENLYAIDTGNNRVQKFDPTLLASATVFGASTFAAYTTGAPERVIATEGGSRLVFSLRNDVTADPPERQILELDPADASVKDTSLAGSGLGSIQGLAFNGITNTLYATTNSSSLYGVLVFGAPLPPPSVVFDPVTVKTDTTATFSASIDPQGGLVSCKFEYSIDQDTWTDLPVPGCSSLSSGGGAQAVSAQATELTPNQQYFVRLQTSRPLVANSTATTSTQPFATVAPPPVVTDVGAVDVSDTSLRVAGTIDPRNAATSYVFEYGATPALGSTTAPLAIGAGTAPVTVSQVLTGLTPATTYYFRIVATNPSGPTASDTHTVQTRITPLPLPEDRGWEMVSPSDKNYTDADNVASGNPTRVGVSPDGSAVGFCTTALFGEDPGRMTTLCAPYISRRSASGWQTSAPFPPFCKTDPASGDETGFLSAFPSADYSRLLIRKPESAGCSIPPLDPNASFEPSSNNQMAYNFYLQDSSGDVPSYDLVNPNGGGELFGETYLGGSDDFSHVVFQSENNQTDPPDSPPPGSFKKFYDWEQQGSGTCLQAGGCLHLVTKDTSNVPFGTASGFPLIGSADGPIQLASATSSDGRRIYFQNPVPVSKQSTAPCAAAGCELYMRENATTTYDVSQSECTVSCGEAQKKADPFISATPSGAVAFFSSCAKLTDESSAPGPEGSGRNPCVDAIAFDGGGQNGSKLYRWERDADVGSRLSDITADDEPADGTQPDFRGLVGHSDDGSIVYFVTGGQLVAGEPTGTGEKLYRWSWNDGSPSVEYLGAYQTFEGKGYGRQFNWEQLHRQVTPDGEYMVIFSRLALDPVADRDSDADLYRWGQADGWTCVSCQLPGAPSGGDVDLSEMWLEYYSGLAGGISSIDPSNLMSEDGQRIFFGTPDALVPQDVNGEVSCPLDTRITPATGVDIYQCEDVYEWHDGTVSLVSSGSGDEPSRLIGSSTSGDDVFFYTRQRLVGWDQDLNTDIYDARVGGGFPEPPPQPAACEGEACRGQGTGAPAAAGAGTAVFQGAGNPPPKKQAKVKKHKKKRHHHRRRHAKHDQRSANNNRRAGR